MQKSVFHKKKKFFIFLGFFVGFFVGLFFDFLGFFE